LTTSEFKKSILALIASIIIEFFVLRIIQIPAKVEDEFNEELISEDEDRIKIA